MESAIELFQISSWTSHQRWLSPVTCRPNEFMGCIRLNSNEQLALSIQDENNPINRQFRIEIRVLIDKIECHSETLRNIALIGESIIVMRAANKLFYYNIQFHEG